MQKISFPSNFGKNQPSPSIPLPSEREELPRHTEKSKKSVLSTVLKNQPSPSIPLQSEREELPHHSEQCKKSLLSTVLKNQPSPSIPLPSEREELPRHTKLIFYPTETLYIITSVNITINFSLEYSQNIRLLKIRNFIYFTCRRWIYVINIYSWNSIE